MFKMIGLFILLSLFSCAQVQKQADRQVSQANMNHIDVGYSYKKCELPTKAGVISPVDITKLVQRPDCAPEVLYAWKTSEEIQKILDLQNENNFLPSQWPVFSYRTPMGFFAFGDFVMRMKLKRGVQFLWKSSPNANVCQTLSAEQKKNTVIFGYYASGKNFSEYIVCSSDVIESWSYATREIYVEMQKEYRWVKSKMSLSGENAEYDRAYRTKKTGTFTDSDYDPNAFFKFKYRGKNWSNEGIHQKYKTVREAIKQGYEGAIFASKGYSNSRKKHYLVNRPDYFNIVSLDEINTPENIVDQSPIKQNKELADQSNVPQEPKAPSKTQNSKNDNVADVGYTRKKCEVNEGAHVVLPVDFKTRKIKPECAPEVLYSWKSAQDVQTFLNESQPNDILPYKGGKSYTGPKNRGVLFLHRTPIGTFAYGDYVVRIKLKPNTQIFLNDKKWDYDNGCIQIPKNQWKNTIIFGYYGGKNFGEYVICSAEVIESWSYGTREIYVEMQKEYKWILDHNRDVTQYDRYYRTLPHDKDYDAKAFFNASVDKKDWSENNLKSKFENLKKLFQSGNNGAFFAAQGSSDEYERHIQVKYPDFFNLSDYSEVEKMEKDLKLKPRQ